MWNQLDSTRPLSTARHPAGATGRVHSHSQALGTTGPCSLRWLRPWDVHTPMCSGTFVGSPELALRGALPVPTLGLAAAKCSGLSRDMPKVQEGWKRGMGTCVKMSQRWSLPKSGGGFSGGKQTNASLLEAALRIHGESSPM